MRGGMQKVSRTRRRNIRACRSWTYVRARDALRIRRRNYSGVSELDVCPRWSQNPSTELSGRVREMRGWTYVQERESVDGIIRTCERDDFHIQERWSQNPSTELSIESVDNGWHHVLLEACACTRLFTFVGMIFACLSTECDVENLS